MKAHVFRYIGCLKELRKLKDRAYLIVRQDGSHLVGREEGAALRIGLVDGVETNISRRHAELIAEGPSVLLKTLPKVRNGTYVNGVRLADEIVVSLQPGMAITFGGNNLIGVGQLPSEYEAAKLRVRQDFMYEYIGYLSVDADKSQTAEPAPLLSSRLLAQAQSEVVLAAGGGTCRATHEVDPTAATGAAEIAVAQQNPNEAPSAAVAQVEAAVAQPTSAVAETRDAPAASSHASLESFLRLLHPTTLSDAAAAAPAAAAAVAPLFPCAFLQRGFELNGEAQRIGLADSERRDFLRATLRREFPGISAVSFGASRASADAVSAGPGMAGDSAALAQPLCGVAPTAAPGAAVVDEHHGDAQNARPIAPRLPGAAAAAADGGSGKPHVDEGEASHRSGAAKRSRPDAVQEHACAEHPDAPPASPSVKRPRNGNPSVEAPAAEAFAAAGAAAAGAGCAPKALAVSAVSPPLPAAERNAAAPAGEVTAAVNPLPADPVPVPAAAAATATATTAAATATVGTAGTTATCVWCEEAVSHARSARVLSACRHVACSPCFEAAIELFLQLQLQLAAEPSSTTPSHSPGSLAAVAAAAPAAANATAPCANLACPACGKVLAAAALLLEINNRLGTAASGAHSGSSRAVRVIANSLSMHVTAAA